MELENLSKKTLADLREIAKMAGIKSVTVYRKDQLLQKLQDLQAAQTPSAAQEDIQAAKVPADTDPAKGAGGASGRGAACTRRTKSPAAAGIPHRGGR